MNSVILRACVYNLRRLISTPRTWAILIFLSLFLENQFAPVRDLLIDEGRTISYPGFLVFLFSDPFVTTVLGMMALMLVFDAPVTDEMEWLIIFRTGRAYWARAQVLYILKVVAVYLIAVCALMLLFMSPYLHFGGGWSDGLEAFVVDGSYEVYDSMLNYDPWILRTYSPQSGAFHALALHFLGYAFLALLMLAVNARFNTRRGFLFAAIPVVMDMVADEFFATGALYLSPLTLTRLTVLDYGDGMGRPGLLYAYLALGILTVALCLIGARLLTKRELME